jgi:hypothetical protein
VRKHWSPQIKENGMTEIEETAKKPYQTPQAVDYGKIADLTKKPGSRSDGQPGVKGHKGVGS